MENRKDWMQMASGVVVLVSILLLFTLVIMCITIPRPKAAEPFVEFQYSTNFPEEEVETISLALNEKHVVQNNMLLWADSETQDTRYSGWIALESGVYYVESGQVYQWKADYPLKRGGIVFPCGAPDGDYDFPVSEEERQQWGCDPFDGWMPYVIRQNGLWTSVPCSFS